MDKEKIDKIISIIDLGFDVLFYNNMVEEADIKRVYIEIRKKLSEL